MEYKIVLVNGTSASEKTKSTATNSKSDGTSESASKAEKSVYEQHKQVVKALAPVGYAVNIAKRVYESNINTVSLRTGNEELQAKLQFQYGIIESGFNIAKSIAIGAYIGNIPGAVIGAIAGAGSEVVNIAIRQNEINIAKGVERTEIFLNNIRAGSAASRQGKTE